MTDIEKLLGAEAESLLSYQCTGIPRDSLQLPGPDFVDRVMAQSDRACLSTQPMKQKAISLKWA